MAIADRYTGKNMYARFIYSGGTVVLTGDWTEFSLEVSTETTDITAGSETDKSYLATLNDATMNFTTFDIGASGTATYAGIKEGTSGTLEWGTQGTASGKPKGGCGAICIGYSMPVPFADTVQREYSFQRSGSWTSDPSTATW